MDDVGHTVADVIVVGGGVVGLLTAYFLASDGTSVTLLEKADLGGEQSSRNWGYIRQQGRDDPEIPMMVQANAFWAGFEDRFETRIGWQQRGNLRLIAAEKDLPWYRDWAAKGNANGIPAELLGQDGIGRLLPGARGSWIGAMYTASDGQADPAVATAAIAEAAAREGARIHPHTTVTKVLTARGRVVGAATPHAVVSAPAVVVATGAWTRKILSPLGINLPLQWIRSTVAETVPVKEFPDIPAVWSPGVAFRKTDRGTILFAASGRADVDVMPSALNNVRTFLPTLTHNLRTFQLGVGRAAVLDARNMLFRSQRFHGWEPKPNARSVSKSYAELVKIYPGISDFPVGRTWAGYIDGTPDNLPVISTVPGIDGLVVGAGFSGHGFGFSPASAAALRDLTTTGTSQEHDLSAFRIGRFSEPGFRAALSVAH